MVSDIKSLKSGVLTFLKQNNRSGFTEKQLLTAFFGNAESASQSDIVEMKKVLESLVEDKSVRKSVLSTKSGQKVYYQGS